MLVAYISCPKERVKLGKIGNLKMILDLRKMFSSFQASIAEVVFV